MNIQADSFGLKLDSSYAKLPATLWQQAKPVAVKKPEVVLLNDALADSLGLNLRGHSDEALAQLFSGNQLPQHSQPLSQAYAGHQFGHFTNLGDGRAHLLGEHLTPNGQRYDIQLKGSGHSPYSRRGDGRAALAPMLRECIMSEAMHALSVPTTRSLAVVTTGEPVLRETVLPGAILTRVAASHIRIGTFEYLAAERNIPALKALADYAIERHYPEIEGNNQRYEAFLNAVIARQISLVTQWLRVGFIHGVMNTDNMSIPGDTIDYGPCAFMDTYHPDTVFSSIDEAGRYAFANQPHITQWNLARFAEAILPLLHEDQARAITVAEQSIDAFTSAFKASWLQMMRGKLGLLSSEETDKELIGDLLQWMQQNQIDYTQLFDHLTTAALPSELAYQQAEFQQFHRKWQSRLARNSQPIEEAYKAMRQHNPVLIPRNHRVEEALNAAQQEGDFAPFRKLMEVLASPYQENAEYAAYKEAPSEQQKVRQTFCGT